MIRTYIAIGSNLGNPINKAQKAIQALQSLPHSKMVKVSSLYSSKPMGPADQPDYINAVAALDTLLSPLELLEHTQAIELEQGRERKNERWGPRTLDLDILLYGDLVLESEQLTLPHYGISVREFVLYPLAEIEPDLCFPDGTSLSYWLTQTKRNQLTQLAIT